MLYTIEKIVDRKKLKDKFHYLIKWQGYPMDQCTWEPIENLKYSLGLVEQYNKAHPIKSAKTYKPRKPKYQKKLLNKKRKEPDNKKNQENESQIQNDFIQNNNDEEKNNININDEETILLDKSLISVFTVKRQNEKLMAVVNKILENGEKVQAYISTEELRKKNPLILLDFYESKIKFI